MAKDNVLMSFSQVCETFRLRSSRVRRWVLAGILKPVLRRGRGRSGAMLFNRGEVSELVYGYCEACGGGYRRTTLKQRFCSAACRKRYHYRTRSRS